MQDISEPIIYHLIDEAWQQPLVQIGLTQSEQLYQTVHLEQHYLIQQVYQYDVIDAQALQLQVLNRIDNDIAITTELNNVIAYSEFYTDHDLSYNLKSNKMGEALAGAKVLVEDTDSFQAILNGHFPENFTNQPSFPVMLGEIDSPYGNSQSTYLSTALIEIIATIAEDSTGNQPHPLDAYWQAYSSVVHVVPVNDAIFDIDLPLKEQFLNEYTFGGLYEHQALGLMTVHNGYAFGGAKLGDPLGVHIYSPEDCSSWIGKMSGYDGPISTADLLNTYRVLTGIGEDYVDKYWYQTAGASLLDYFNPVVAYEPQDVQPGSIMVVRRFANETHDDLGIGGHTGVVIGVDNDQILLLSYNRDMPQVEGFGLRWFDFHVDESREVFFLAPKLKPSDMLVMSEDEVLFWDDVTEYCPSQASHHATLTDLFQSELDGSLESLFG